MAKAHSGFRSVQKALVSREDVPPPGASKKGIPGAKAMKPAAVPGAKPMGARSGMKRGC